MALLTFEIKKIPDLSLNKYQSLSDTGIDGLLNRHSSFLRQWHGISMESQTSFHLLYCFIPKEKVGHRLKVFFIIQSNDENLKILKALLKKSSLGDFYEFIESDLPDISFKSGATLVKNERIAEIYNPLTSSIKSVHYVPKWEMNKDARLYDLLRIMETISNSLEQQKECAYRVDLYPISAIDSTRNLMTPILKDLQGENDIRLTKEGTTDSRNSYAQNVCKEYENWLTTLESSPHFAVNIYGFSDELFLSKVILNTVGSEALKEGDFSIAPIKAEVDGQYGVTSRLNTTPYEYCFYPNTALVKNWATTYSLADVEPFFRFPVLFDGERVDLPKETDPLLFEDGIYLGSDEYGFPVMFPLEDLTRHAFFTGTPGAGKTNSMLHLVTELKRKDVPFLILEPAKKEYREILANPKMEDVWLFSPHLQSHFPLRMNPFEFPEGVRLSEHINALLEVFQGSFVLEGPTLKFLSNAIQKAYTNLGWDIEDKNTKDKAYPRLQDIYDNLESEINASSYDGELKGNVRAFLQVRLGGLMERDAGELFNTTISTLNPEEWLSESAIVELEVLNEQAKNFFVLLVCHYILETLRKNPQDDYSKKQVRHAMFIEEAHNIIAPSTQQPGTGAVDPKISATAYIVKMLAEVRALGEAIIIADQLPTALATEVVKNTGLKIVHRLTSQDDRNQIGTAISASAVQLEQMASFTKGKALIYYEKCLKPYTLQVAKWSDIELDYNFGIDEQLFERIRQRNVINASIATALKSWYEKIYPQLYEGLCVLREKFSLVANDDIAELALFESSRTLLQIECEYAIKKCIQLKQLWEINDDIDSCKELKEVNGIFNEIYNQICIIKESTDKLKI